MSLDGRIEKRVPLMVSVYLMSAEGRPFAERVLTENVSSHGARVLTKRLWLPTEQPRLAPLSGECELPARVAYCQSLRNELFGLGLEFRTRSIQWGEGPWHRTP
jgi:hypothetical protein